MKLNFDSYNENNEFGAELALLDLDFNKDIEEMDMPSVYDPVPHGEDEDED